MVHSPQNVCIAHSTRLKGVDFQPDIPVVYRTSGANVAQLAEQIIRNDQVVGSIPTVGSRNTLYLLFIRNSVIDRHTLNTFSICSVPYYVTVLPCKTETLLIYLCNS